MSSSPSPFRKDNHGYSIIETKTLKLSTLTATRDSKRQQLEALFEQQQQIRKRMEQMNHELQDLDAEIDVCERDIQDHNDVSYEEDELVNRPQQHEQYEKQPLMTMTMTMNPDEHLPEPHDEEAEDIAAFYNDHHQEHPPMPSPQLEIITTTDRTTQKATSTPLSHYSYRDTLQQPSQTGTNTMLPLAPHQQHLASDNFPWSAAIQELLTKSFKIQSFRGYQKEIINSTLSGDDVFVIMRTGGGKSLTYQLPAILEGRGPHAKVTFVISPLLSLIQDQEDQMNDICRGSALSFSSGLTGGPTEHARRWNLVRDPKAGVCLVFVTPEKVSQSNKLRGELEKLHAQQRLGRFVIDECHCATMYGHDFRPDYTKLGVLKTHFPTIPILAVTATASDRVRMDCCDILNIQQNYQFFRSTAHRPNLTYSVQSKPDGKDNIIDEMAAFIKEKHPKDAGIVYAFSRKDADDIAIKLKARGIVAESYHSDVGKAKKEKIHHSWMRNKTQVVCATIAFGLGINKPDVRFVLHHTLSKTIEAYYQESGRAGRDGKAANCVLYYSPKDVPRMIGMIEGKERGFWPMVRYAQANGNDAICKSIILSKLGEPDIQPVAQVDAANALLTNDERDVGIHAQTVTRLLQQKMNENDNVTLPMLVKEWRVKNSPYDFVKNNPPGNDLTVDECERVVISLLLEEILAPKIAYTAYNTVMYVVLGQHGQRLIASLHPRVNIRFPKKLASSTNTVAKARKSISSTDDGWINTKPRAKRKVATTPKGQGVSKPAAIKKRKTTTVKPKKADLVIELSSDESFNDAPVSALKRRSIKSAATSVKNAKLDDPSYIEEENEFC